MGKSKISIRHRDPAVAGAAIYLLLPVLLLAILNFILVFTPEIGFDALWYHLTLPKLWLLKGQYFFPGGLLYYSVMPRLTETIFTVLIYFFGTVGPKLLQFLSGLGICFYLFKTAKHLGLKPFFQVACVSLFYCTWLVSWESSSAYIDLFRTFLETVALYYLVVGKRFLGGVFLGLALGTKWLALFSIFLYCLFFGWSLLLPVFAVSLPWFLIAYHFTGNPVYPLFNPILQNGFQSIPGIIKNFVSSPFILTFPFDDFISPLIGALFVLSLFGLYYLTGTKRKLAFVGVLGALSTLVLSPPSARFLIPFLPPLIISALLFWQQFTKGLDRLFFGFVLLSSIAILCLRLFAFQKYLPYLTGAQKQNQFLTSLSSRLPDTFIDSDGFVAENLPPNASYLIDNLHNLYYFPYNFDHTSWANKSLQYDYLITQKVDPSQIPGRLIHTNELGIQVFKLP